MFTAALFVIARTRKQPRCPSTEEWIKKMWYIYTMECHSMVNKQKKTKQKQNKQTKTDILKFAGKWTKLGKIILSKVIRSRETNMVYTHS